MSPRFISLLMSVLLLMQALTIVHANAAATGMAPAPAQHTAQAMHHDCGDAGMQHDSGTNAALAAAMCASHCAAALTSMPLTAVASCATVECPQTTLIALQTRSDIPPTPPPIV